MLEDKILEYVSNFRELPEKKGSFRSNPYLIKFFDTRRIIPDVVDELCDSLEDNSNMQKGIKVVLDNDFDDYDAGFPLGIMNCSYENDLGSEEFRKGFFDGQIVSLKREGSSFENKVRKYSMGALMLTSTSLVLNTSLLDPDKTEFLKDFMKYAGSVAGLSVLYGGVVMGVTKLFANDDNPSDSLIKFGAFKMHRNPFYASLSLAMASLISMGVAIDVCSVESSYLTDIGMALSFIGFEYSYHISALRDEAVLEKQFGEEYLQYKKETPRYFPAVWKLFSK